MKIARSIVIGGLLLAGSSLAEAGWLGGGSGLPKPVDVLKISRPWDASHTQHALRLHKYTKPGWGAQWKQVFRTNPYRAHPYVRGY